jgi:hypothetical protein
MQSPTLHDGTPEKKDCFLPGTPPGVGGGIGRPVMYHTPTSRTQGNFLRRYYTLPSFNIFNSQFTAIRYLSGFWLFDAGYHFLKGTRRAMMNFVNYDVPKASGYFIDTPGESLHHTDS